MPIARGPFRRGRATTTTTRPGQSACCPIWSSRRSRSYGTPRPPNAYNDPTGNMARLRTTKLNIYICPSDPVPFVASKPASDPPVPGRQTATVGGRSIASAVRMRVEDAPEPYYVRPSTEQQAVSFTATEQLDLPPLQLSRGIRREGQSSMRRADPMPGAWVTVGWRTLKQQK